MPITVATRPVVAPVTVASLTGPRQDPEARWGLWDRTFGVELECVVPIRAQDGRRWESRSSWHEGTYPSSSVMVRDGMYPLLDAYGEIANDEWGIRPVPDRDHQDLPFQVTRFLGWNIGSDGSVHSDYANGVESNFAMEIRSPILNGRGGFHRLRRFFRRVARPLGIGVNDSCGTHVHLGVQDLDGRQIKQLFVSYHRSWPAIQQLIARRRRNSSWCQPLGARDLDEAMRMPDATFRDHVRQYGGYYGMTARAFHDYGTLEVRSHQGTMSYEKISQWVKFLLRFAHACKEADGVIAESDLATLLRRIRTPRREREWYLRRAQELALPQARRTIGRRRAAEVVEE